MRSCTCTHDTHTGTIIALRSEFDSNSDCCDVSYAPIYSVLALYLADC